MSNDKIDLKEFSEQKDTSSWHFTSWVQVAEARWQEQSEKFWRVPAGTKDRRYALCKECDSYLAKTTQCKECLCFMGIKTWLGGFACPQGKWSAEEQPAQES